MGDEEVVGLAGVPGRARGRGRLGHHVEGLVIVRPAASTKVAGN